MCVCLRVHTLTNQLQGCQAEMWHAYCLLDLMMINQDHQAWMIHTLVYWWFSQKNVLLTHQCQKNCETSGKSYNPLRVVFSVLSVLGTVCPKLMNLTLCSSIRHIFILLPLKPIIKRSEGLFTEFKVSFTQQVLHWFDTICLLAMAWAPPSELSWTLDQRR